MSVFKVSDIVKSKVDGFVGTILATSGWCHCVCGNGDIIFDELSCDECDLEPATADELRKYTAITIGCDESEIDEASKNPSFDIWAPTCDAMARINCDYYTNFMPTKDSTDDYLNKVAKESLAIENDLEFFFVTVESYSRNKNYVSTYYGSIASEVFREIQNIRKTYRGKTSRKMIDDCIKEMRQLVKAEFYDDNSDSQS
jgi:hypothetical protein